MVSCIAALLGVVGGLITQTGLTPLLRYLEIGLNRTFQNMPVDVSTLTESLRRGNIDLSTYQDRCKNLGFDSSAAELFRNNTELLLTAYDYITAWRRGFLFSDDHLKYYLKNLGLDAQHIGLLVQLTEFYPQPQDLIRFAVREIYSPEMRSKLIDIEPPPQQFLDAAKKAGLMEEQATNYWAAHWELPGIRNAFEMLYRTDFSEEDLDLLLKALDVMPYYRKYLKEIAYQPLTRVDVRRMYGLGVLDEKGVRLSYKHLGYNAYNAEKMTEFTIKYVAGVDKELSKTEIFKAYEIYLIDENEMREMLDMIGYSEDAIEVYVALQEYKRVQAELKQEVNRIKSLVKTNQLTKDQANIELQRLGQPATFTEAIMKDIEITSETTVRQPAKSDYIDWLKKGIIDEKTFMQSMSTIGYKRSDILFYMQEIIIEIADYKRRYLPIKTYQRWFSEQVLTVEEFTTIALGMQYSEDDIDRLIDEASGVKTEVEIREAYPSKTDIIQWFADEVISEEEFIDMMIVSGYVPKTIDLYVQQVLKAKEINAKKL